MVKAAALLALILPSAALAEAPLSAEHQEQLTHLVVQDCGSCHGLKLTGGLGRAITPEALQGHTVDGLQTIILDGIPGTAMPPWRPLLTEAEAAWIAAYLLEVRE
ncbi:cytochrome c [Marivita sp. S6314]|uniref:c-type cytochrome n=1 Tax=Marivita sp. S6314 TaxID=2926406 RepID=UPI001FF5A7E4|nr:cytochrome c [Marivita sp. S6314]MCK0150476.1 cytochrome c [Marivita sp. S6314]